MAMELQSFLREVRCDETWLEQVLFQLGETFEIRIKWNTDTAVLTGVFALAGGLVGAYTRGRMGAAVGAGIGGGVGLGVSTYVSLREIWTSVKHQLEEIFYIIVNYLRKMDPEDYRRAFQLLLACPPTLNTLGLIIRDFICSKLATEVFTNIIAA